MDGFVLCDLWDWRSRWGRAFRHVIEKIVRSAGFSLKATF